MRPLWTGEWREIAGFTRETVTILPWYLRIAECVKRYGRYGYVYEDGLGFPLKERFWLNPLALAIYHALKVQLFAFLSAFLFIASLFVSALWLHIPAIEVLGVLFLVVGSPLFLASFFHYAKPEILSWVFFPLALIAFSQGLYGPTVIFLIVIAFLNFTVALISLETIFLYALLSSHLLQGILVVFPAAFIIFLDFIPLLRRSIISGLVEVIGGGKATSRSDNFLQLHLEDSYLLFFYGLFIITAFVQRVSYVEIVILLNALFLFLLNQKVFRFSDHHTFFRFFLAVSSFFLLLHPTPIIFVFYILLIYVSPAALLGLRDRFIKDYPSLRPYSLKAPNTFFGKRFAFISQGERIAFERDDTEKSMEGFKNVFYYFEYLFWKRSIEFLPGEWLRLTQTNYFTKEYIKINWKSNKTVVKEKCEELGARYVMTHSDRFRQMLQGWGYREITVIRARDLKNHLWNTRGLPAEDLAVFEVPFPVSFISPSVPVRISPNAIEFEGKKNVEYIIRWNFHPSWKARQDSGEIPVYPVSLPVSFIGLRAMSDGVVNLRFRAYLLR